MAAKKKAANRSKKLASGKKMAGVKPLTKYLTYELTDPQVSHISLSSGNGSTSN